MTDVDGLRAEPEPCLGLTRRSWTSPQGRRAIPRALHTFHDYVFDGAKGSYSEEDTPNPRSVYAAASGRRGGGVDRRKESRSAGWQSSTAGGAGPRHLRGHRRRLAARGEAGEGVHRSGGLASSRQRAEMVIGVHRSGAQGLFHCAGARRSRASISAAPWPASWERTSR